VGEGVGGVVGWGGGGWSGVGYSSGAFFTTSFPPVALRPNVNQGLLIHEVSRSHTTTLHSQ